MKQCAYPGHSNSVIFGLSFDITGRSHGLVNVRLPAQHIETRSLLAGLSEMRVNEAASAGRISALTDPAQEAINCPVTRNNPNAIDEALPSQLEPSRLNLDEPIGY